MLEQSIDLLTNEVSRLIVAIEATHLEVYRCADPAPPTVPQIEVEAAPTIDEKAAAGLLGVSVALVRKWRRHQEGPQYIRLGRLVRYSRQDVIAWLKARKV
jgi:predicted DNA-binding transcriptional regulator AlpA